MLNPYFVTGLSDAESCFLISVIHNTSHRLNWVTRARFVINLHLAELPLLLKIQEFFGGVGFITKDSKNNKVSFTITRLEDLINTIIPHFNSYPLLTKKRLDFILWSKVVNSMQTGGHLTIAGLHNILSIKASINNGLSPTLMAAFPEVIAFDRGEIDLVTTITDPQWLVGFITGDGSFSASSSNNKRKAFRARFFLTQHARDLGLLEAINNYFGGVGSLHKNGVAFNYEVGSYKDCYNYILPFFFEHPIPSVAIKFKNFKVWKQIVEIMNSGDHKNEVGMLQINKLLLELNKIQY